MHSYSDQYILNFPVTIINNSSKVSFTKIISFKLEAESPDHVIQKLSGLLERQLNLPKEVTINYVKS